MADSFDFQIVTPQRAAFAGTAAEVTLPGTGGEIGILPGHRALVTLIQPGTVTVHTAGTTRRFAVGSGFAEVAGGRVTLLTTFCEGAEEVDIAAAREALASYEKQDPSSLDDETARAAYHEELGRARARVALVDHARGK